MQSNTIKLLSCLTSWEELRMDLKSWVTHQLLGFNLSFLLMLILLKLKYLAENGIALITNNEAWFDDEAA